MALVGRVCIVLSVFCCAPLAAQTKEVEPTPIESAFAEIEAAYPKQAYIGGSFSAFFGGLSLSQGADILRDHNSNRDARRAGRLLVGVGSIRVIDGLARILTEPPALKTARAFRSGTMPDPAVNLKSLAHKSRSARIWRAHLVLATGLTYLYLAERHKAYRDEAGPGLFLVGLAAFQYWRTSAEERAAAPLLTAPSRSPVLGVGFGPTNATVSLRWSF